MSYALYKFINSVMTDGIPQFDKTISYSTGSDPVTILAEILP